MPRALTCARSQQKCSEARLDKTRDRKCSRYFSETKNASKNEPHFQGPKNMDMLQFYANNHVLVTFFSAHCNCADFREFFQIAMLQNHENFHVFQLFTTDVF